MTDIDFFKRVNDSYGHAVGDLVLKAFAAELTRNIRNIDFLARYGGEEFVLLLPNAGLTEALAMAERMREAIKQIRLAEYPLSITASFGVISVQPNETMSEVLKRADKAMYLSKTRGRDRVSSIEVIEPDSD